MDETAPAPTGDRPVFVLASGPRCGSTLLQRLLNSHPDLLVWGEAGGFLNRVAPAIGDLRGWGAAYDSQRAAFREAGHDTFSANLLPDDGELSAAAVAFLRALFAEPAARRGKPRWGFKETRCDARIARFLRALLPGARIVHLTRDPSDVLRSLAEWEAGSPAWSGDLTADALADWERVNASFRDDPAAADLSLMYESLTAQPAATAAALAAALALDPAGFDLGVFARRLHWEGEERADRMAPAGAAPLSGRHQALLDRPNLRELAASLGYDTDGTERRARPVPAG